MSNKVPSKANSLINALFAHTCLWMGVFGYSLSNLFFEVSEAQRTQKLMPEVGMPLISAMLALLLICSILDTDVEAAVTFGCRPGSFPVENTTSSACFAVLDPGANPMNASDARNKCMTQNPLSDLVYVMKKVSSHVFVDQMSRPAVPGTFIRLFHSQFSTVISC